MKDPVFQLGKMVEISVSEGHQLRQLADEMHSFARTRPAGWFLRYLTAHREAHTIITTIMKRSHASS